MARVLLVGPNGTVVESAEVGSVWDRPGWAWLDLEVTEIELVQELADRLGWDRLEVEDVFDDAPAGKVVDAGAHLFTVFHTVSTAAGKISSVEVDTFLTGDLLVTVRHGGIPEVDDLWDAAVRNLGMTDGGPDRMLARLAGVLTSRMLPLIDLLEDRIEAVEALSMQRDRTVIGEVQALRGDLTRIRRIVGPQREVLAALARDGSFPVIGHRARRRLADVHEQMTRIVESIDGARVLLGSALETYRSAVAEETNTVMKVLTVFSAIMLPLTLMAGIWGMNFENMPELEWPVGYWLALGAMALVATGLWWLFARIGFVSISAFRSLPRAIGLGLWEVATLPLKVVGKALDPIPDGEDPPVDF